MGLAKRGDPNDLQTRRGDDEGHWRKDAIETLRS